MRSGFVYVIGDTPTLRLGGSYMKICYIAPVAIVSANAITVKAAERQTEQEMSWVQEQVYNALSQFWGDLCIWLNEQWIRFIDMSFVFCLTIAFMGAICGILGIKTGYKVTILSIVFYLFLRLASYLMGWY